MKTTKLMAVCVLAGLAAACSMDRKSNGDESEKKMQIVGQMTDNAVYGTLEDVDADGLLHVCVESGDTLTVKLLDDDSMSGEMIPGSRLSIVMADSKGTVASKVVNLTMLFGEWVELSPLAEGTYCGIKIMDGGSAASINSQTTNYEGWRLLEGRLLLMSSAMGLGSEEQMVDTFEITKLTQDSLSLSSSGFKFYFCRQDMVKEGTEVAGYRDEDDAAGNYDVFSPEAEAPEGENSEDGLLY